MIEPTNWWRTKAVLFIARHTPKCRDITRLISRSLDGPLPSRVRLSMRVHYLICVWCKRYRDQLALIGRATPAVPERDPGSSAGGLYAPAKTRLKLRMLSKE